MNRDTRGPAHEHIQRALPWYVNGTLREPERERIDAHLAGCEDCRAAVRRERRLAGALLEPGPLHLAPQAALSRVMERIETRERRHRWFAPLRRLLQVRRPGQRLLVLAVAVQAVVIVLLTAALWLGLPGAPAPGYRTLTTPMPAAAGARTTQRLRVVFVEDLTLSDLRSMLRPLDLEIVAGPGERGIYTLATRGEPGEAVSALRAHPAVRFAEAVREP